MGAYVSGFFKSEQESEQELTITKFDENINLDNMTKGQIIDFIKTLKIKSLIISPDLIDKLKSIEFKNTNLMTICIELYIKSYNIFIDIPINTGIQNQNQGKIKRKFMNVKPGFTKNDVLKTQENKRNIKIIENDINNIQLPIHEFKKNLITLDEFMDSFNDNVAKKDMIGSSKRLYQNIPEFLRRCIINTFNELYKTRKDMNKICFGKCTYVYKGQKKGTPDNINAFRPIISIPNIVNIFHRILMIRLSDHMINNNYIDTDIQKGGIKCAKSPIFEQIFKLKETLRHANTNKKPLVITFIDIGNAFGNIDRENLFKVLEFYKVDQNFIEYFREYYNNLEFYVDCQGLKTELIKWLDGLIQGDAISPLFFIIVMNYILKYINNKHGNKYGYEIDNKYLLFTAFIDDIAIITNSIDGAQIVFDELNEILLSFGLPIGIAKCAIMLVNINGEFIGSLGTIQKVQRFKYLGEYISADGTCVESFNDFVRFLRGRMYGIDTKPIENYQKVEMFNTHLRPWIQRRLVMMYDLSDVNKIYITKLVREFIMKWDYLTHSNTPLELFNNPLQMISESNDSWINTLPLYEENKESEDYIEFNSKLTTPQIEITYETVEADNNIDDDDGLQLSS